MGIFSDDEEKKKNDYDYGLETFVAGALIGAGLFAYWLYSFLGTPRGQTILGGGLTSTGLKMIRDNWNKQE